MKFIGQVCFISLIHGLSHIYVQSAGPAFKCLLFVFLQLVLMVNCLVMEKNTQTPSQVGILLQMSWDALRPVG